MAMVRCGVCTVPHMWWYGFRCNAGIVCAGVMGVLGVMGACVLWRGTIGESTGEGAGGMLRVAERYSAVWHGVAGKLDEVRKHVAAKVVGRVGG
jgi:hypothetical protein